VKEIEQYRDLFINREDAYATQRMDGSYICRKEEVSDQVLVDHLKGRITCGWYCLNTANQIKWACVDADSEDGQKLLQRMSQRPKGLEIPSYIEESREGRGHLWIFLEPLAAKPVRKVLKRVVEEGMEVFPKQNRISRKGYGSLVRGPLGIHLRTGRRYGFLETLTGMEYYQESGPIVPQFPPIVKWSGGQVPLGSPQIRALSTTSATTKATSGKLGGSAFGILRFSTSRHPEALAACYAAA
jgi:hypothetical protein